MIYPNRCKEGTCKQPNDCIITDAGVPIHSEKELADFMADQMNSPIPLNTPQFRTWLVQDYTPGCSIIIIKMHHSFTDGLGVITLLAA